MSNLFNEPAFLDESSEFPHFSKTCISPRKNGLDFNSGAYPGFELEAEIQAI